MKILLDTHTFLWWISNDHQLSETARQLMSESMHYIYWSAASSWEVAIKYNLGRLPLPEGPEVFIPQELKKNRIDSVPVKNIHALYAGTLPQHHQDPFDRMLIAQAQTESLVLLSNDSIFPKYNVQVMW